MAGPDLEDALADLLAGGKRRTPEADAAPDDLDRLRRRLREWQQSA